MSDPELDAIRRKKMEQMMKMGTETDAIPNEVIEIGTADAFNKIVNGSHKSLILVDCWAPWCGPCRAFAPIFKKLQKKYQEKGVIFTKLNTDNHREIAMQFQITGIPTTLFIYNNKLVHRSVGLQNESQFSATIEEILKKIEEKD